MNALHLLTPGLLVKLGAPAKAADTYAEPMKAAFALFDVTTPEGIAALLGQCLTETGKLTRFTENLYYTTPAVLASRFSRVRSLPPPEQATYLKNPEKLANLVYADRYGNGDAASGDGWKYRGRGLIQTTFKANYESAAKLTGRPYVEHPELLADPSDAALSAAAYFVSKGCLTIANTGLTDPNLKKITGLVNKGMLEAELRRELSLKAYALLNVKD